MGTDSTLLLLSEGDPHWVGEVSGDGEATCSGIASVTNEDRATRAGLEGRARGGLQLLGEKLSKMSNVGCVLQGLIQVDGLGGQAPQVAAEERSRGEGHSDRHDPASDLSQCARGNAPRCQGVEWLAELPGAQGISVGGVQQGVASIRISALGPGVRKGKAGRDGAVCMPHRHSSKDVYGRGQRRGHAVWSG